MYREPRTISSWLVRRFEHVKPISPTSETWIRVVSLSTCAPCAACGACTVPTSLLIRFKMSAFVVATFSLPLTLSSGRTNVLRVSNFLQHRQAWD